MRIAPLSEEAIGFVICNLSEVSRKEAEAFGMDADSLKRMFMEKIGGPFTGAIYGYNDNCFALVSMDRIGESNWRTRFVATEEAFGRQTNWIPLTRFLKGFSDKVVSDIGGEIEILSDRRNEKSRAWFLCMGFRHGADEGNISTYFKKAG
jgi:hypothetical protein